MASNIKVAHNVSSDGAIITGFRYVDAPTVTLGSEGGSDNPTPTTTRIIAVHAYSTIVGDIAISGSKQITNKTAKGNALRYRVGATDSNDAYIGDMGVAAWYCKSFYFWCSSYGPNNYSVCRLTCLTIAILKQTSLTLLRMMGLSFLTKFLSLFRRLSFVW